VRWDGKPIHSYSACAVLVLVIETVWASEHEYEYHFIEYEYDFCRNIATSKLVRWDGKPIHSYSACAVLVIVLVLETVWASEYEYEFCRNIETPKLVHWAGNRIHSLARRAGIVQDHPECGLVQLV
jgi:hypothetical protein